MPAGAGLTVISVKYKSNLNSKRICNWNAIYLSRISCQTELIKVPVLLKKLTDHSKRDVYLLLDFLLKFLKVANY